MQKVSVSLFLLALAAFASAPALAQRAYDNALNEAEDAFGTTVGNESIGLYTSQQVRGFSPVSAGNVRVEGLYFDQQTGLGNHLIRGSTLRVGLTAQSYPFPAPTGIIDYQLRLPGDKPVYSVVAAYGAYDKFTLDVDTQTPLIDKKLGLVAGAGFSQDAYDWASDSVSWSAGALLRWRPTDNVELIPFWSRSEKYDWEVRPYIYPAGAFEPPDIHRRSYFSQEWADWEERDTAFGMLARTYLGDNWTLRGGFFRTVSNRPESYLIFYRNTQPDRSADVHILADPLQKSSSYSGEVRASGTFTEGPRRHTVHIAARGRDKDRLFGGEDVVPVGQGFIGVYTPFPKPDFMFGPQGDDQERQGTLGITYEGRWRDVGEFSVGLQKTFYKRTIRLPGNATPVSSIDRPWLYNGTLALYVTDKLALYGSYTRGLEATGVAPDNATNRGEALPASITEQVDAGIRYAITPDLRFMIGVFDVRKPYLDRDINQLFRDVGSITHRGIEMSLSGELIEGLRVVAGAVFLEGRISGFTVDQGTIGEVPPGRFPRTVRLNVQYAPPAWAGISFDAEVQNQGARFADRLNTFKLRSFTTIDLGARYQFELYDKPAQLRIELANLTNLYVWNVFGAQGWYFPSNTRRVSARFSIDF